MSATSDTNNTSLTEDLTDKPLKHTTNNQIDNTHDTQNKEINECNQVNTNLLNKKEDNNIEPKYNKSNEVTIIKDTTKIENNKKNDESNIPQTNTKKSFTDLNNNITNSNNNITLYNNYEFKNDTDTALNNAIHIYKNNFTINGNYKTIDANNTKFLFRIKGENITINNLIFKNGINLLFTNVVNLIINNATFENCINDKFSGNSAIHAIVARNSEFTINNGLFENKNDIHWSLIYASNSKLIIINTTFTNITSQYATAIYAENCESYINNSRFINLFANKTGGALAFKESNNVTIENCEFINVSSNKNGGAIFSDINGIEGKGQGLILIDNTLFSNCSSGFGGACLQLGGQLLISYSNFTSNYADFNGGAIYTSSADSMIESCIFKDNHLGIYEGYPTYGGAIFCDYGDLYLYDSEFINNSAYQGSGVYSYDSYYELLNLTFTNNSNPAIYTFFDEEHSTKEDIKGITLNLTDFNNTYYPGVLCGEGMKIVLVNNTINITDIPTHYDLRELNLTSPIRDQGHMGACWAFGMTAALESALIKALNYTNPDFSENNMQNTMLIYSQYGSSILIEGGNNILSIAYLLSWFGAFPQDYDSYDELGKISPIIRTDEDIHVQDIILISNTPLTKTNNDINRLNNVKETILKYGALCGNLYLNDNFYNRNTYGYYTPNRLGINHAICVVGWDDNYPASNFLNDCPGNGAWIVKNSYGSKWGDEGYFYVSYYDQTLSPSNRGFCFVAISLENTLQYNKNYQYDLSGLDSFNVDYNKYLNKFESVEDDVIAAVGTYFNKEGVDYTVEIIVNDISIYTQTGVSPYNGYHTIKLDKYIPIKKGDIFSIKITSNAVPISIRTRVHFENGTSFKYEPNSEKWEDLSKNKYVACIKAYTLPQLIKTENLKIINGDELFIVDVNETNANVIVSINNNILSEITDENGIAKFKLPELKNGNYTITTTYNQTNILNTIEVNIDLYKIIKEQNQTINTLNETINELNNLTQTQNQTINTLNETTKEQTQKLNKTNEDLKNTKTQIKTLNNEINTLKKQIENLKKQQKTTPKTTTQITAKPKTYKTKTKVKKYTITLKTKKGKALTQATIYLTIKGKKYKKTIKTKTNLKGKATFKIKKLTRKGKYTATITYKGNKNYKKSSKKVKIIIK